MEKSQSLAVRFALLAIFLWSTVASAFKIALGLAQPIQILVFSSFVSLVALLLIRHFSKETSPLISEFKRYPVRFALAGFINPVVYYLVLFEAYDFLPAQIAQTINYTWGIVLALLAAPILKQKLSKYDLIGLFICYLGVVILITRLDFDAGLQFNQTGLILALLSTILWASYWLLTAKIQTPPITALSISFLCASPWLIAITLMHYTEFDFSFTTFASTIYIGLFEMSVSFVFWLMAIKYASNTAQISSLIYLSPFLSLILIYFLVGEAIYPTTLLALIVICVGLFIQKRKPKAPIAVN